MSKPPFIYAIKTPTKKFKFLTFLDIDGVINNEDLGKRCCNGTASPHEYKFNISQELVNTLEGFKHFGDDIAIVISSSRRYDYGIKGWSTILKGAFGLTIPIIGMTPHCQSGVRGAEIKMWLSEHCENFTGKYSYQFREFIIIDDDDDVLLSQAPNFIQTNGYLGLHYNDVNKGCSYLANDPFYFNKS